MRAFLLPVLLMVASGALADGRDTMTAYEAKAAASISERGKAIYFYDQAAWHTTDTLKADIADLGSSGIRGWVVRPVREALKVTYYGSDGSRYWAIYSAIYDGGMVRDRHVYTKGESAELGPEEQRLIAAQRTANELVEKLVKEKKVFGCSPARFNTVVMPPKAEGNPIAVYFLTPQTVNTELPMGGHYRVDIREGRSPEWRAFTRGCLNMTIPPQKDAVLFISHMMDPLPTEVHSFLSLTSRRAIGVITVPQGSVWGLENGTITLEKRKIEK